MMMTFSPGSPQVCSTRGECDALFKSLKVEMKAKSALQRAKLLAQRPAPAPLAQQPVPQMPDPSEVYAARREGRTLSAAPTLTTTPPRLLSAAEIYAARRTDSQAAETGAQCPVTITPRNHP